MTILLVNDDGPKSPALAPFAAALGRFEEVRSVIPSEEQSWIAMAITRFRPLFVKPAAVGGTKGYFVSGTPADCVQLGVNNLFNDPPDLIVSGINLGSNAGLGFLLSSGTLGAAVEASLLGYPAIAVSVSIPREIFSAWGLRDYEVLSSYESNWNRIAAAAAVLCRKVFESGACSKADLISLNLPWEVTEDSEVVVTPVAKTGFEGFFEGDAETGYRHSFRALIRRKAASEPPQGDDIDIVAQGRVSLTPINLNLNTAEERAQIARLIGGAVSS